MITQAQIGAVTFNDNSNYFLTGITGLEMPPVRLINYDLAGENFGIFVNALYGKRRFSLQGWVKGDTTTEFIQKRDALQQALDVTTGEQPIMFTPSKGRLLQISAVMTMIDFAITGDHITAAPFNISFEASFPFLIGQTTTNADVFLPTGGGGTVPPPTMPMALSFGTGGNITVTNNGNAPIYPTARINGPATNPVLRNHTTALELRFAITLTAGQYLDVDFKRKTVVDQDGRNRFDTKSGTWWLIGLGTSELRFISDVYDANAKATITYRDTYLGL